MRSPSPPEDEQGSARDLLQRQEGREREEHRAWCGRYRDLKAAEDLKALMERLQVARDQ